MLQIICLDVDGTLLGSDNALHPRVRSALIVAREKGILPLLCTGRASFGRAFDLAAELASGGWHIFQSGAAIVRPADGALLSNGLQTADVVALTEAADQHGLLLELYSERRFVVNKTHHWAGEHAEMLGVATPRTDMAPFLDGTEAALRAQWLVNDEQLPLLRDITPAHLELHAARSPRMRKTHFVSVTPRGVGKAAAIRTVAQKMKVPIEKVMMVGDGDNDIGAFGAAGVAVAMENGTTAAKNAAAHIVGHVDELGLLAAIELATTLD